MCVGIIPYNMSVKLYICVVKNVCEMRSEKCTHRL